MKIAITGASGLIGSAIVEQFFKKGYSFHCLQRNREQGGLFYKPEKIDNLDGQIDAVIHLAGENVATGLWTGKKKHRIRQSRIQGTHEIASYFSSFNKPPKTLVCASAIGYYGDCGDMKLTEESPKGEGFLSDVCKDWEDATEIASEAEMRIVLARFGMVLSPNGGALHKMLPAFKMGAGGVIGNGEQYMSWISIRDLTAAIEHVLLNENISGPVNFVSPTPVTNREFTKIFGRVLKRYTPFTIPSFAVKLLFGAMGKEMLLASSRVFPEKLKKNGFSFRHTSLRETLYHCIDKD